MSFIEKSHKKSITIIVPAFNEELNLAETINSIDSAILGYDLSVEIIIVNDGSLDGTKQIANLLASKDSRIRTVHLPKNQGLGNAYFTGVQEATKDYVVMIPGDNECGAEALSPLLLLLGESDMIIPYPINSEIRSKFRQVTSKIFTTLVNCLAGLQIYYYNGTVIHQRHLLQRCPIRSKGFAYQAKIIIYMIYNGASYQHAPIKLNRNKTRASSAFRFKNFISVGHSLLQIILYRLFRKIEWFST